MSIQRGSDKHGPRVDDQRKHEAEGVVRGGGTTRAREWNEPETVRDPEEDLNTRRRAPGHEPGTPLGITPADVERRSNLAKWLSDTRYPADRNALLAHAKAKNAPDAVIEAVSKLPDLKFHNVGEVAEALGLGVERRW